MRILYFANNYAGYEVLKFLKRENENIIALVLHPDSKEKYKKEMISLYPNLKVIEGNKLKETEIIQEIKDLNPEIFLSVYFGYILSPTLLKIPPKKAFNLHPAYLPFNKGAQPNIWPIIDNTPAGATIHYMDERADTGDIIAREKVDIDYTDTGKTIYEKTEKKSIELFKKIWSIIKNNKISTISPKEQGTMHYVKDFATLDEIDLNKKYYPLDLINILRARTFPPYKGTFFKINDQKYYIEVRILKEDK